MNKVIELARKAAAQNGDTLKDVPEKETVEFIQAFYTLARADLEAEVFRLREHIIDQTKLEQEINQLRKERQAFKDVTEYQKAENAKLTETIKSLNSALTNTSRGNAKLKAALQRVATSKNSALDLAYCKGKRDALGETK